MYEKNRQPNFDLHPVTVIDGVTSYSGYEQITQLLKNRIAKEKAEKEKLVVVFDSYHGVNQSKIYKNIIKGLGADLVIDSETARLPEEVIFERFKKFIVPEDRTYGMYSVSTVDEYFDEAMVEALKEKIDNAAGLVVVYGIASSILTRGDILVYGNIAYPELNIRLAQGLDNWGAKNYSEELLKKQKRGMFIEWRMLDRHKRPLLKAMDYMIDFTKEDKPVAVTGDDYRKAIEEITNRPFKPNPIFTKSIWGGQWLQKVLGAKPDWENVGWALTGILEIQSINLRCGENTLEVPCNDLLFYKPREILGNKIFYFWGYKSPVHVNYLDTWGGGNLSLQVHPTTDYAFEVFNSSYGHHESYYIMDATDHSSVYLGLKEGTKVPELVQALKDAQNPGVGFDDTKYINKLPVKKHDHVFIPGGTVHCSGEGTVVLEIDLFCFATFKLWDWDRVDYDGRPRPINIDHGQYNIQENFQGDWVTDNLVSKQKELARGNGWRMENSSTMSYEPMTVNRYWFTKPICLNTDDAIIIHVLVEGEEAVIESLDNSFEPYVIHYAEAVFVPANIGQYVIKPYGKSVNEELAVLQIFYPQK
ncbi:class I mannose-6-phosphate isomerase [Clostridium sp. KNHs216]|uniref:class I mannose-6-phosphate isomerase n=1 Tax=Clostridium sp. KNHs216 TaxID=1550235 RepID=UPI00114F1149|nr:class I mannose-6-phosphate isomerase [Clostridium sp. KNHs216]TQI68930.1 mannose-6-phosphate isomerase class I [Clostridium sp. KNHs216]